jgi:diguanylate cyclase (GGDEF)-like protein
VERISASAGAVGTLDPYRTPDLTRAGARERAGVHTAAAERLARLGRWDQAYDHLRAAVRLLQGQPGPSDELDRLRREHAEARELSRRDSLTATYNRRYLDECLLAMLGGATTPLSVALVDIDHFKQVNDTHGHLVGDRVLRRLVDLLGDDLPEGAFCARFGGEEFALVLPGCCDDDAVAVCEAAREHVARHRWDEVAEGLRVTVSIGVAHCTTDRTAPGPATPGRTAEVERLVGEADTLLYVAKQGGRNAVAFRGADADTVRLAGPAGGRRAVPQPPPFRAGRGR